METTTELNPLALHTNANRESKSLFQRTRAAVRDTLHELLPAHGHVLAIASGTGAEVGWLAQQMPLATWQPTETDPQQLSMLTGYVKTLNHPNLQAPRLLEVRNPCWPLAGAPYNLIYCADLLSRAPRSSCADLMRGAALLLAPGGALVTRGPFLEDDVLTSPEHLALDDELRTFNPNWGLRRREDLETCAAQADLQLTQRIDLPQGDLLLVWEHAIRTRNSSKNPAWL